MILVLLASGVLLTTQAPSRDGGEKELQSAIDRAVEKGIAWLKARQKEDGSFGPINSSRPGRVFETGATAIALFALVSCGEPRSSPVVARAAEFLVQRPPRLTYELGLTLLAFDAKAAPPTENRDLERMSPKERAAYAFPREFSTRERALLEACVKRLLETRRFGLWSYGDSEENPDLSNTQYALLGLKAAARCGVAVPGEVWADALRYFLQFQIPSGPEFYLPEPRKQGGGFTQLPANARAWAYARENLDPADQYGSRANIGISCLVMSREEIEIRREHAALLAKLKPRIAKVDEAVRDALAWLVMNYAVDRNPPKGDFLYYYLYSLERMGTQTDRKLLGKHDWYRDGAEFLLKAQLPDGNWPGTGWSGDLPNTCFALLFFRRATVPSVTTGAR